MKIKIFILFVVLAGLLCSTVAFADDTILKVATITGKVLVKIAPSAEWTAASVGQTLNPKDAIKTEAGAKTTLEFPNKSAFSLKPNSELTIDELIWNNVVKKVGVNLSSGELRTMIKKMDTPSDFKVKTPTAICGARGTTFYVIVFTDGTGVYVEDGLVDFLSTISGETYTVYKGMNSEVHADGSVTPPRELTKAEVAAIIADYDVEPVAEPYTEPEGAKKDVDDTDVIVPDVIPEQVASKT